jgi:hypothetical protein
MMNWFRRAAGLIAGLLVAAMGVAFLAAGIPLVGAALLVLGGGAAVWQGWRMYATRPDPYDLNRLWEAPPADEEPDPTDELLQDEAGVAYCHHCGHAVAGPFARCPECGGRLR